MKIDHELSGKIKTKGYKKMIYSSTEHTYKWDIPLSEAHVNWECQENQVFW